MNNNIALGANDSGISRKKFLASSVVAVVAGGLAADKAQGVTTSESACLSASFTGTSDAGGNMVFPHGLGALLPANMSTMPRLRLPAACQTRLLKWVSFIPRMAHPGKTYCHSVVEKECQFLSETRSYRKEYPGLRADPE